MVCPSVTLYALQSYDDHIVMNPNYKTLQHSCFPSQMSQEMLPFKIITTCQNLTKLYNYIWLVHAINIAICSGNNIADTMTIIMKPNPALCVLK